MAQGNDLEFSLNEVRSHFGLTTGVVVDDISFDAATRQINSLIGSLPAFIPGQQIFVLGATTNNGLFTVDAIINPGFAISVIENLTDEPRQNPLAGKIVLENHSIQVSEARIFQVSPQASK